MTQCRLLTQKKETTFERTIFKKIDLINIPILPRSEPMFGLTQLIHTNQKRWLQHDKFRLIACTNQFCPNSIRSRSVCCLCVCVRVCLQNALSKFNAFSFVHEIDKHTQQRSDFDSTKENQNILFDTLTTSRAHTRTVCETVTEKHRCVYD